MKFGLGVSVCISAAVGEAAEPGPAPIVTACDPATGTFAGGTAVTITGTDFVDGATVTFDGVPATSVVWVSATEITCVTPAGAAGTADIVVTNPDAQFDTLENGFTYDSAGAAPTVTDCTPDAGALAGGTAVTISGTDFVDGVGLSVEFDGAPATSVVWVSATEITCVTPAGSGAADITVINPDLQEDTLSAGYTFQAAPVVTSVTPDAGALAGLTEVVIAGTGFLAGATVTFGGAAATSVVVDSAIQITCDLPAHAAGDVDVVVENTDDQTGTLVDGYTYQAAPAFTSITPDNGKLAAGTAVVIAGTGFLTGIAVEFDGVTATSIVVDSAIQITCVAPAHAAGDVDIYLENTDGQNDTESNGYHFNAAPTVTSVTPNAGTVGTQAVVIAGTGFLSGATVTFGGTSATGVSVDSSIQISCTAPAHAAGAVNVVVTNADTQTGTGSNAYTYVAAPTVTSVVPSLTLAAGGETITLTGTGFTGATGVTFGGTAGTSLNVVNSTTATIVAPAKANGRYDVVITTTGGNGTLTNGQAYITSTLRLRPSYSGSPWNDESGNGRNFTEGTAPPAVGSNLNSRGTVADYVEGSGSNDRLLSTATLGDVVDADGFLVWVLVNIDAINSDLANQWQNDLIFGASTGFTMCAKTTGPTLQCRYAATSGTPVVEATISTGAWLALSFRYNGTNIYAGVNGVESAGVAANNIGAAALANTLATGYIANGKLDGKIAEIFVCDYDPGTTILTHATAYAQGYYGV